MATTEATPVVRDVRLVDIRPDPDQPRKSFPAEKMKSLVSSMREAGLLTPISIRPDPSEDGKYLINAGERRFRSASQLEWATIPAIVDYEGEHSSRRLQLMENIVREDLNIVDECRAYKKWQDDGLDMDELSRLVGYSKGVIQRCIDVLRANTNVLYMLRKGQIPLLTAYQISRVPPEHQQRAMRAIVSNEYGLEDSTTVVEKVLADLSQGDMMPETVEEPVRRKASMDFDRTQRVCTTELNRLLDMEESKPGNLGRHLGRRVPDALEWARAAQGQLRAIEKALRRHQVEESVD